jgi:GR25 family glycosyltransferase involved in LPS biosynthesis
MSRAHRRRKRLHHFWSISTLIYVLLVFLYNLLPSEINEDGKVGRLVPRMIRYIRRNVGCRWNSRLSHVRQVALYGNSSSSYQIYVLNLQRIRYRSEKLEQQLNQMRMSYEIVPAIDGFDNFDSADMALYAGPRRKELFSKCEGSHLKSPAAQTQGRLLHERMRFGCYLTHVHIWKNILESPFPHGLILEDDVRLVENAQQLLSSLLTRIPDKWDLLYLNAGHTYYVGEVRTGIRMLKGALGTYAYMISQAGARKLLEEIALNSDAPIDHVIDKGIYTSNLLAFETEPKLAVHEAIIPSTLNYVY